MNLIGRACVVLFRIQLTFGYSTEALDYLLRALEYLESVHAGVFSVVFWDISAPDQAHDNIQQAVLEANRPTNIVRYVVKGIRPAALKIVPWSPSVLFIWPGYDVEYLEREDIKRDIYSSLEWIDPSTKVMTFADLVNVQMVRIIRSHINDVGFSYFVIFDSRTLHTFQRNGVHQWIRPGAPHHMHLFTMRHRWITGYSIVYVKNEDQYPFAWNYIWVHETARYLYTNAVEYRHNCHGSGMSFYKCLDKQWDRQSGYDIIFTPDAAVGLCSRHSRGLFTGIPLFVDIAVPRDRPLNVAELLMMPFSWQVWVVLVTTLVISELTKYMLPELFKNNPILLAVCGLERYNLHRAGSLERILFLSLIILLFFMSNAFETKIVSLMVRKPAIQRIKTLEDLAKSDLKFHFDLDSNPHFANDPVIGKMVTRGSNPSIYDTMPGVAMLWYNDMAELRKELAYDYERMQPYYVLLGYRLFHTMELYWTYNRFLLLESFQLIHARLVEAGLIDLWKRVWRHWMRFVYIGRRRIRASIDSKMDLRFEDLHLAWTSLTIGVILSGVAFVLEIFSGRCIVELSNFWRLRTITV